MLIVPSLVGRLLLGEELTGIAIPVARVAGIALIALGLACWPGPPLVGMLTYSAVVTLYLAYLGFAGLAGILLWPAVVLHMILTAPLVRAWFKDRQSKGIESTRETRRPGPEMGRQGDLYEPVYRLSQHVSAIIVNCDNQRTYN